MRNKRATCIDLAGPAPAARLLVLPAGIRTAEDLAENFVRNFGDGTDSSCMGSVYQAGAMVTGTESSAVCTELARRTLFCTEFQPLSCKIGKGSGSKSGSIWRASASLFIWLKRPITARTSE